jgi:hypothetical protein
MGNLFKQNLTKGIQMEELKNEITDETREKLIEIRNKLYDIESLSRIMLACLNDEDNLKNLDIETIFDILKCKIAETRAEFNDIVIILNS